MSLNKHGCKNSYARDILLNTRPKNTLHPLSISISGTLVLVVSWYPRYREPLVWDSSANLKRSESLPTADSEVYDGDSEEPHFKYPISKIFTLEFETFTENLLFREVKKKQILIVFCESTLF